MSRFACPLDSARLIQVRAINAQGDGVSRWECPNGDWQGPWFTGGDTDEIHQIPELSRRVVLTKAAGNGAGGGDPNVPDLTGAWSYYAGTVGTVQVAAGQRVIGLAAAAPSNMAASLSINGGATIPIPAGRGVDLRPVAQLVAPTVVFTDTASYMIEVLAE